MGRKRKKIAGPAPFPAGDFPEAACSADRAPLLTTMCILLIISATFLLNMTKFYLGEFQGNAEAYAAKAHEKGRTIPWQLVRMGDSIARGVPLPNEAVLAAVQELGDNIRDIERRGLPERTVDLTLVDSSVVESMDWDPSMVRAAALPRLLEMKRHLRKKFRGCTDPTSVSV